MWNTPSHWCSSSILPRDATPCHPLPEEDDSFNYGVRGRGCARCREDTPFSREPCLRDKGFPRNQLGNVAFVRNKRRSLASFHVPAPELARLISFFSLALAFGNGFAVAWAPFCWPLSTRTFTLNARQAWPDRFPEKPRFASSLTALETVPATPPRFVNNLHKTNLSRTSPTETLP